MPTDARQALRIRRFLIGSATSLLVMVALFAAAHIGVLPAGIAITGSAMILALILLFYAVFRSGLNLRRADPSLTAEMVGAAILILAYIMYYAAHARSALSMFYLVALLFGVLRLDTRRLLALAALALGAHAAILSLAYAREPAMDLKEAGIGFVVLVIVLPWFAVMGGFVNALRQRLSDSHRQLKDAYQRIEQIAVRDELTGLYNRRFLLDLLARERSRAKRLKTEFAACLFDIDHFKSINDSFGHSVGDAVLKRFALIANSGLRDVDVLGRYGGEEFLMILPDTGVVGARSAAERIRRLVESAAFQQLPEGRKVTVTIGVACSRQDEDTEGLIGRADAALYQGKAAGRNCVVAVG